HHLREQLRHLDVVDDQLYAGFNASQVEQALNYARDLLNATLDFLHVTLLPLIDLSGDGQHGQIAAHEGQRAAEVMGNRSHKLRFEVVEFLELGDIVEHGDATHNLPVAANNCRDARIKGAPVVAGDLQVAHPLFTFGQCCH